MNILLLSWNFPPVLGGIEYVVGNLYDGLRAAGHRVTLVTSQRARSAPGGDVHRCPRPGMPAYALYAFTRGHAVLGSRRPDVIVCGSVVSAPAAWLLSRLHGVPWVLLVHGADVVHRGFVYQRVVPFLLRRAQRVAANSGCTRDLLRRAGVSAGRVSVIHPGVRVGDFDISGSLPAGLADRVRGRRVLLTVGRLVPRKGVLEFVEKVLPALRERFPDLLYIVVGDDASHALAQPARMRARIERRVRELGLDEAVYLAGELAHEALLGVFQLAQVFVLPCLDIPGDVEGFGIVFSEAALAGLPSVATRVGGIPDAVRDGETGVLVSPGDPAALAEAVAALLDDEPRRRALAAAGARRAREELSWEVVTARYVALFEQAGHV